MSHSEFVLGQDVLSDGDLCEAIDLGLRAWNLKVLVPISPNNPVIGKCPGEDQLMRTFTARNTTAS